MAVKAAFFNAVRSTLSDGSLNCLLGSIVCQQLRN